jgi:hypothetical protein
MEETVVQYLIDAASLFYREDNPVDVVDLLSSRIANHVACMSYLEMEPIFLHLMMMIT